jgi:hypothetical protein
LQRSIDAQSQGWCDLCAITHPVCHIDIAGRYPTSRASPLSYTPDECHGIATSVAFFDP